MNQNVKDIIELFNNSIQEYIGIRRLTNIDPNAASKIQKFNQANQLFTAIEALLKVPLIRDGIITDQHLQFHQLIELSLRHLTPSPLEAGIDLQFILKYRDTRNKMVHNYNFPDVDPIPRLILNTRRFIRTYIDAQTQLVEFPNIDESFDLHKFLAECNEGFQFVDHTFVLITGPMHDCSKAELEALTRLPWNIVIDFDCQSEQRGLREAFRVEEDNIADFSPEMLSVVQTSDLMVKPLVYYFADGNSNNMAPRYSNNELSSRFGEWSARNRTLHSGENQLETIVNRFINGRDVEMTIVYLMDYDEDFFASISGIFRRSGIVYKIVFVNLNNSQLLRMKAERTVDGTLVVVEGQLQHVLQVLCEYTEITALNKSTEEYRIPYLEGTANDGKITAIVYKEASAFFDVLHFDFIDPTENIDYKGLRTEFLKGGEVDWHIIANGDVVKTEPVRRFGKEILMYLQNGGKDGQTAGEFYIKHRPGFGGTTAAKVIAWDIHTKYPVLYLKHYDPNYFMITVRNIYASSSKRLLIVIDEEYVNNAQIESIRTEVFASTLPIVLLFIGRREDNTSGPNTLKLFYYTKDDILSFINHYRLFLSYDEMGGTRRLLDMNDDELSELINNKYDRNDICPFLVGLSIYKDEFIGVKDYVKEFIDTFDGAQESAFVFLALSNYFIDSGLPKSFLSRLMFGKDHRGELFPIAYEGLSYKFTKKNLTYYSIRHYLLAKELLQWLLTAKRYDGQWVRRLPAYCNELINAVYEYMGEKETARRLLQQLFIDVKEGIAPYETDDVVADDKRKIHKQFSPLMGILILHDENVYPIFEQLMALFPNDAHFFGHTARYFAYVKRDYKQARYYAKQAIDIQERDDSPDPNLYHILGMCVRQELYDLFRENREDDLSGDFWANVMELVAESKSFFDKTSLHGKINNKEYACLSSLQMYMKVLNEARKFGMIGAEWIDIFINTAGELIDEMEEYAIYNVAEDKLRQIANFRIELKEFFGDIPKSLMEWRNEYDKAKQIDDTSRCLHACRRMVYLYELNYDGLHNVPPKKLDEFIGLFESSLYKNPDNERDLKLWFKVARYSGSRTLSSIESFVDWLHSVNPKNHQVKLYRYMIQVLMAFEGDFNSKEKAKNYIDDCSKSSRQLPGRTRSYEFYGVEHGIRRLISRNRLADRKDIWKNDELAYIKGRFQFKEDSGSYIIPYDKFGKQLQFIIFVKPSETSPKLGSIHNGKDVQFKFGFSLDGLRAENRSVKLFEERPVPKRFTENPKQQSATKTQTQVEALQGQANEDGLDMDQKLEMLKKRFQGK
ncbi:hypothetical protein ACFQZE_17195 [Paenibacillus sp. GCM10027627]|uniref:hypothetical protein n=1 Tax=unclassified Paenibacillus TaxID=185978 RepID=UPI0036281AFC